MRSALDKQKQYFKTRTQNSQPIPSDSKDTGVAAMLVHHFKRSYKGETFCQRYTNMCPTCRRWLHVHSPYNAYAWFNFTCYHPLPGQPGDKSNPSVPGVGNCLKPSCPGGRGAGQIEINFLLFLWSTSLLGWRRTAWRRLPISRENL